MGIGWQDAAVVSALVFSAVALALVAGVLISATRQRRRQAEMMESLRSDLRALCTAAVTVGQRVNRLERGVTAVSKRQEELGMRQDQMAQWEPEEHSFQHAIKLATRGASVEELIEVCGLPQGEAELIAMMHRLEDAG